MGHSPDDASDEARAGALMLAEHHALLNAFVRGVSKSAASTATPAARLRLRR